MFSEKGPRPPELTKLQREIKKEIEYPHFINYEIVEKWGDGIPAFAEADPVAPEWKATPVVHIDLSKDGLGEIFVKNEADRESNPTGTIKDRAAWELATLYRDYARALYLKIRTGALDKKGLERLVMPRFSLITAGNEGKAVAECFKKYDLPPPKLIIGKNTRSTIINELIKLRADVYIADLSSELTTEDIKQISNNSCGIDITSIQAIEPSSVFYDWHVHESFNESPDDIYVPYGSGRLMENYLVWQARSMRNESKRRRDPRLKVSISKVITMNVFGAEPAEYPSEADKLVAPFKPFLLFKDEDINALVNLSFTGSETGKNKITEEKIRQAYQLLTSHGIEVEPSSATSLALYIDRFEKGLVKSGRKTLIINTGKGLI